ncbi:MAG TPA: lysylphosphatidylglycerol synthase transmembrane domain-containing protein [Ktedonobacteraceae bacterium]|nr:lysylphosphatidylglycerol synthase transmembrane domain-containing protein [Ktedonobacteraceae bacterium]
MFTSNKSSASEENQAEDIEGKKSQLLQPEVDGDQEITRDQLSLGKRLLNWRTIIPLVIVLASLAYLVYKENINPQQTWDTIRTANILFFLVAFFIYYLSFLIRTLRWRMLLRNVGFTRANGVKLPGFWKLLEIIYLSFFANVVVPARLGELYRAYLLRQEAGVSATRTFGTVLAERLLDFIVLLLLFIPAAIISLHENIPSQLRLGLYATLALVMVGVCSLIALRLFRAHIGRMIPARFREYYNHFQEGTLGSFKRVPALTGLTVTVWLCEALRFFFIAMALNLFSGNLGHIFAAALFIALGESLLTIVPFTGGGVGLVEGGMLAMIALFRPNALSLAAAAILLDRAISLLSILVFGFVVFMIEFGRQTARQQKQVEQKVVIPKEPAVVPK